MKILFVCSANVDRSPTAEYIYKDRAGLEVKSAGTACYAQKPVNKELVQWADAILCMESRHKRYIVEVFANIISNKMIDILNIKTLIRGEVCEYRHPALIEIIREKTDAWLHENHAEIRNEIEKEK